MTAVWLLVLATGASPAEIADSANAGTAVVSAVAPQDTGAFSPQQVRDAVAAAFKRLDSATGSDRAAAVKQLIDVYRQIGENQHLKPYERNRLGSQVRTRLERVANQLRFETKRAAAHSAPAANTVAKVEPAADAPDTVAGWINDVVGGPGDWILAQRVAGPAGGQAGAAGGAGGNGNGSDFDQMVNTNGAALVNLIQKTVAPNSWDVNGGAGSVTFYNNLRALVVRQTEETHSDLDAVLNGLRRQ